MVIIYLLIISDPIRGTFNIQHLTFNIHHSTFKMCLFVDDFTFQNLEGVEVNPIVERKNGIADGGIIGQPNVLL